MRKVLVLALPLAVMADVGSVLGVRAATTVSGGQNTPASTSATGDLTVSSGGSITVTGVTPVVTIDSSNAVSNAGALSVKDVSGSTGVLMLGGVTGGLTNAGSITVDESFSASDSANADSIAEAPYASGSGRAAIRLTGPGTFNGSILNSGTITVQGNSSYGVSLETPLAGGLTHTGSIVLTGDGGSALRELAGISGALTLAGGVSAKGQASTAVDLEGDVGGRVSVSAAIVSTGYATITRPAAGTGLTNVEKTATDVEQGGSALVIGGNVGGGVLLTSPPVGAATGTLADVDGDGTADSGEGSATVTSYGAAPAMVIGAPGRSIVLGPVAGSDLENAAQPANAYALVNRGVIQGLGLFDGVSATALQIGGQIGGQASGAVSLSGGLRNVGTISATSYAADATAITVGAGAAIPELRNEGIVQAIISASTDANTARALVIGAGGAVASLTNTGSLLATVTGDKASATVVADHGGGLSSVLNEGLITAVINPSVANGPYAGTKIALDLRANTTGVTLVQQTNPTVGVVYGSTSGTDATAVTAATATVPSITGDVLLGSGPNTVRLLAGSVTGALDLGSGSAALTLDNGATYLGDLRYAGPTLALNVANGTLTDETARTLRLSSFNLGTTGKLIVAIDPAAGSATSLQVSGPATLAAGSSIGFISRSLLQGSQSYVILTSPNLTSGGSVLSLTTSPYLFDSSLVTDPTPGAGTLTLKVRLRTPTELGFGAGETAAFNVVYAALPGDTQVEAALFSATDRTSFLKSYDRLLPDYAGGVLDLFDQAARATAAAALTPDVADTGSARIWTQEIVLGARRSAEAANGYSTGGLGVAGGAETPMSVLGALGVHVAFMAGEISDTDGPKVQVYGLQGGLYWRAVYGGLQLGALGGVGYDWLSSTRTFSGVDQTGAAFDRSAAGKWNALQFNGHGGAAYELRFGRFFVRPQAYVDYVRVNEDSYAETGGGSALNLAVADRSGHEFSGAATIGAGWTWGSGFVRWRPEVTAGVRDVVSGDAGATTAHFTSGGDSFTLLPDSLRGTGVVAGASITAESEAFRVGVEASGESRGGREEGDILLRAKALF